MDATTRERLLDLFASFPEVKLAYFFGSRSRGTEGPLSDYDFAVYVDEQDALKAHDIRVRLMERICQILQSDRVDVVMLNSAVNPELKYHAMAGILRAGTLQGAGGAQPFERILRPPYAPSPESPYPGMNGPRR